jgi:transposase-like protein
MTRNERETHWQRIIDQQSASSQSVTAFCRERKIDQWSFYRWRRRLSKHGQGDFLELQVCAAAVNTTNTPNAGLRIRLRETIIIEIEPDFDPPTLRAVVDALGS